MFAHPTNNENSCKPYLLISTRYAYDIANMLSSSSVGEEAPSARKTLAYTWYTVEAPALPCDGSEREREQVRM